MRQTAKGQKRERRKRKDRGMKTEELHLKKQLCQEQTERKIQGGENKSLEGIIKGWKACYSMLTNLGFLNW